MEITIKLTDEDMTHERRFLLRELFADTVSLPYMMGDGSFRVPIAGAEHIMGATVEQAAVKTEVVGDSVLANFKPPRTRKKPGHVEAAEMPLHVENDPPEPSGDIAVVEPSGDPTGPLKGSGEPSQGQYVEQSETVSLTDPAAVGDDEAKAAAITDRELQNACAAKQEAGLRAGSQTVNSDIRALVGSFAGTGKGPTAIPQPMRAAFLRQLGRL